MRAYILGIYWAAIVLIAVLWLFDFKAESTIPMLFGVLGFDGGLTNGKRHFGNPDWFHWTRQYHVVAGIVLFLFVAGQWLYYIMVRRLIRDEFAALQTRVIESACRAVVWTMLLAALIACVMADHWTNYFFEPTELKFYGLWPMRVSRSPRCIMAVATTLFVAGCLTPLLQFRKKPSLGQVRLHLFAALMVGTILALIGSAELQNDQGNYFSSGKSVFILAGVSGTFALGVIFALLPGLPITPRPRIEARSIGTGITCVLILVAMCMAYSAIFDSSYVRLAVEGYRPIGRRGSIWHPYKFVPALLICCGIFAIGTAWAAWQKQASISAGHCAGCDYDLRGTIAAGRSECPECGTAIDPRTSETPGA